MANVMGEVEFKLKRAESFAHAYAFARASGKTPWEASVATSAQGHGVSPMLQREIRDLVEDAILNYLRETA